MLHARNLIVAVVVALSLSCTGTAQAGDCSSGSFSSTFELIQKVVFENHQCSSSVCHGSAATGGLDLSPDVAYHNLVDVAAQTATGFDRVRTGQKDRSLLWLNLAAKTYPDLYTAPLRAMPLDPVPALTENELELVRRWIESGAPRTGVVSGTADLVDACLPPVEPIEITPLPPPAAGTGVQIHMPQWTLEARSEHEVCYAGYYDVTDQVPTEFRGPSGTTFRYKRTDVRQDPLSHHLIVNLYAGTTPVTSPAWGTFRCQGGALNGQTCNPEDLDACGADSGCSTNPRPSIACIGFGPGDAGISLNSAGFIATQETAAETTYAPGVYGELPLKGIVLFNSHAFNLTDTAGKLEAWMNFEFAAPEEQVTPLQGIFNISSIFAMQVPAFGTEEVCAVNELPPNSHLFELSSHTHKRGKRFRTYAGAWHCATASPSDAQASDGSTPRPILPPPPAKKGCSPLGSDFGSPDICDGAPCVSTQRVPAGDCNYDNVVTVNEVVTGINIALDTGTIDHCRDADGDGDNRVAVNELVTAVNAVLGGMPARVARDPEESLLYVNSIYNDPFVLRFNPPRIYPGEGSSAEDRSLTYCSLYDNGFTDSDEVKRKSTSPRPPFGIAIAGGPCDTPTHCTGGLVGEPCSGANAAERDASCDSTDGAGDGECDACPLRGGVTTEDEMFILLGQYYVP